MFTRTVTIVAASALLFGCSSTPSVEEVVDERLAAISSQEWDDMCDAYDFFGPEFIEDLMETTAEGEDISEEELTYTIQRINEECEAR